MEPPLAPVRRLITERRAPSSQSGLKKNCRLIYVDAVTTGPTSRDGRVWPHEVTTDGKDANGSLRSPEISAWRVARHFGVRAAHPWLIARVDASVGRRSARQRNCGVQSLPEKVGVLCPPGTPPFRGLFLRARRENLVLARTRSPRRNAGGSCKGAKSQRNPEGRSLIHRSSKNVGMMLSSFCGVLCNSVDWIRIQLRELRGSA